MRLRDIAFGGLLLLPLTAAAQGPIIRPGTAELPLAEPQLAALHHHLQDVPSPCEISARPAHVINGRCLAVINGGSTELQPDPPERASLPIEILGSRPLWAGTEVDVRPLGGPLTSSQPFVSSCGDGSLELVVASADQQPISRLTLEADSGSAGPEDHGTVRGKVKLVIQVRFLDASGELVEERELSLELDATGRWVLQDGETVTVPANPSGSGNPTGRSNLVLTSAPPETDPACHYFLDVWQPERKEWLFLRCDFCPPNPCGGSTSTMTWCERPLANF